ncbi:hypothetical protein AB0K12_28440 [Nonomuraea sp. NPDC049419]|uniref:hypothetical protein n=1 Tax=Nonomuraea sp. NPDC049419 TaxID=3155772 RepID=UPI003436B90B
MDDTAFYAAPGTFTRHDPGSRFLIENADAATKLKTEFLDEQWSNSEHAAICDHDW